MARLYRVPVEITKSWERRRPACWSPKASRSACDPRVVITIGDERFAAGGGEVRDGWRAHQAVRWDVVSTEKSMTTARHRNTHRRLLRASRALRAPAWWLIGVAAFLLHSEPHDRDVEIAGLFLFLLAFGLLAVADLLMSRETRELFCALADDRARHSSRSFRSLLRQDPGRLWRAPGRARRTLPARRSSGFGIRPTFPARRLSAVAFRGCARR